MNVWGRRLDAILASAKDIYVSGCAVEITHVPDLLRQHRPVDATVTGIFNPVINRRSYADAEIGLRARSFFLGRELQRDLALGLVDYCPWRYGIIDRWLSADGRFDTVLAMVSPPDAMGNCSLGPQADFLPSFLHKVERIVGFINPNVPRTAGEGLISYSSFSDVVDHDVPLINSRDRKPDAVASKIAAVIAGFIPDGATIQLGIGQIPTAVIECLTGHRKLRVHSGVIDGNISMLEECGTIDRSAPIVAGVAIGSREFYGSLERNSRYEFRPVSYTHAHDSISRIDRFFAVNSVMQVDLLGQVSAEVSGSRMVASPGGLPDFVRGALDSHGGSSIIAVRASGSGGQGKGVVPLLESPHLVTSPHVDADVVVSEYGAAHIRGLSFDRRAEALIAIADPSDHDYLAQQWSSIRSRGLA